MEPPPTFDPATPILSIRHRLASIVNRELEKMERGEIEELSVQHNDMLQQLTSLYVSSSGSVTLSESDPSNLVPTQPDVSPVILVPSFVLSCSYWSICVGVITSCLVCCPVRVPRTMNLYLRPSW